MLDDRRVWNVIYLPPPTLLPLRTLLLFSIIFRQIHMSVGQKISREIGYPNRRYRIVVITVPRILHHPKYGYSQFHNSVLGLVYCWVYYLTGQGISKYTRAFKATLRPSGSWHYIGRRFIRAVRTVCRSEANLLVHAPECQKT